MYIFNAHAESTFVNFCMDTLPTQSISGERGRRDWHRKGGDISLTFNAQYEKGKGDASLQVWCI